MSRQWSRASVSPVIVRTIMNVSARRTVKSATSLTDEENVVSLWPSESPTNLVDVRICCISVWRSHPHMYPRSFSPLDVVPPAPMSLRCILWWKIRSSRAQCSAKSSWTSLKCETFTSSSQVRKKKWISFFPFSLHTIFFLKEQAVLFDYRYRKTG